MRRRQFIAMIGGATVAWPLTARAQQGTRMRRVGILMPYPANDPQAQARNAAFLEALQQLGWTVGNNITAHHDALEFPDGQIVLLTALVEGQRATVLQLPAEPKTESEAEAQERAAYVS
jgi:hypothetical protein